MAEKHCTRVYFTLRESKKNKYGKSPIEASIVCNGERIYFNTGKSAFYKDWNKDKQCVKGKSEEALIINDYLEQLRNKVLKKEIELMEYGYLVTPYLLKDALFDKIDAINEKTILEIANIHNIEKKQLIGISVAPETYYSFDYSTRLIKEFIKTKYHREDLFLREINMGFIQSFHTYLLGTKRMKQNTTTKHLKFLKKLLNLAVSCNYIKYNTINNFKVEKEPVEIDFLDETELRKIINFETPLERLERARDTFLFGCFTGLSYIDIKTLSKEHFEKDESGRIWIKKRRVKTGILSRIPLLPMAKMILEKYKGKDKLLPIQDPSDVNLYLKDIAILCGINKNITFHTSRHTFASTVTLANNISLEVVSKMMGHTNTRMTAHYAKLVDNTIAKQMDKIKDIF